MIREVTFKNWKSFSDASLPIEALTFLIGTNSSGKSNALDALELLSRIAEAIDLNSAVVGSHALQEIRGGADWASFKNSNIFTISILIEGEDERTDYRYEISLERTEYSVELNAEQLSRVRYQGPRERELRLFWTEDPEPGAPGISCRLYNGKAGTKLAVRRNLSALIQLEVQELRAEIRTAVSLVLKALRGIFILDPNPSSMRKYVRLSEDLQRDGGNAAGVIAALEPDRRKQVERDLSKYAAKIPEKDITRVWAETVDRHNNDAMLYCLEEWTADYKHEVDARGMSDGTLRFVAVISALLTRPSGSLIVVEEIDNGLHPSRAIDLLQAIREISSDRQIDILVTTHNVALLDALPPEVIGSVSVAIRNPDSGASEIRTLDELPSLGRLMAEGTLGQLATKRKIEEGFITDFFDD